MVVEIPMSTKKTLTQKSNENINLEGWVEIAFSLTLSNLGWLKQVSRTKMRCLKCTSFKKFAFKSSSGITTLMYTASDYNLI